MRLLLLGERKLGEDRDLLAKRVRSSLHSLSPRLVMSDLSEGWTILATREARELALPLMGVFPYEEVIGNKLYQMDRASLLRDISNKIVFEKSQLGFFKSPQRYVDWVSKHTDSVLCYVDQERSSVTHAVMLKLKSMGKRVHNLHRSQHD